MSAGLKGLDRIEVEASEIITPSAQGAGRVSTHAGLGVAMDQYMT